MSFLIHSTALWRECYRSTCLRWLYFATGPRHLYLYYCGYCLYFWFTSERVTARFFLTMSLYFPPLAAFRFGVPVSYWRHHYKRSAVEFECLRHGISAGVMYEFRISPARVETYITLHRKNLKACSRYHKRLPGQTGHGRLTPVRPPWLSNGIQGVRLSSNSHHTLAAGRMPALSQLFLFKSIAVSLWRTIILSHNDIIVESLPVELGVRVAANQRQMTGIFNEQQGCRFNNRQRELASICEIPRVSKLVRI